MWRARLNSPIVRRVSRNNATASQATARHSFQRICGSGVLDRAARSLAGGLANVMRVKALEGVELLNGAARVADAAGAGWSHLMSGLLVANAAGRMNFAPAASHSAHHHAGETFA